MQYIVTRTSLWGDEWSDVKPCEEAFKHTYEKWQIATCSEKMFDKRHSKRNGTWRSKGKNHDVTKEGNIRRQVDNTMKWTVKISNLEGLNRFVEKYGEIIISKLISLKAIQIEICD